MRTWMQFALASILVYSVYAFFYINIHSNIFTILLVSFLLLADYKFKCKKFTLTMILLSMFCL